MRFDHRGANGRQLARRASALARSDDTSAIAASLSTPVGSPVRGSFTMTPFARVGRATGDARELQRPRIRPAGMSVVRRQDTRVDRARARSSICRDGRPPGNGA